MIVVLALLALAATMIVPRVVGTHKRALNLATEQVSDLLTMYAQRDTLSGRPAGIWHDARRNALQLMVLDIDPSEPDQPADWRPDPFVRPVELPPSIPADGVWLRADGKLVDIRQWPISNSPSQLREAIEIGLVDDDGDSRTLVLPGNALVPSLLGDERDDERSNLRQPVDLDAAGRHREDW